MSDRFSGNLGDLIEDLSENNFGAKNLLMILTGGSPMTGLELMSNLKDMGIRGPLIWVAYKDFCNQDLDLYIEKVESKDPELIEYINGCKKKMGLI